MQQKNIKLFIYPLISLGIFIVLVFGAAYAYIPGTINMNTANYQVTLPSQTSLICTRTNCSVTVTPAMMTNTNTSSTEKVSNTCSVNCTCSGTPNAVCSYNVYLQNVGMPYYPSTGLGTNKELTVNVTSPSGCTVQNTSNVETQVNTQAGKIVSNCTLTVPQSGSVSANVTAEFKWYNLNLNQDINLNKIYNYRLVAGYMLPAEYQQVEYLIFDGAEQIPTNYSFNYDTDGVFVTFQASTDAQNGMMIGSTSGSYLWMYYYQSGNRISIYGNSTTGQVSTPVKTRDLNKHTMGILNKLTYFDGVKLTDWTSKSFSTQRPLYVGSYGGGYYFQGNIYGVTMYRNNAISMDLIPCYRKSDNVAGMYDIISGNFLLNNGSGTLVAGPDILD